MATSLFESSDWTNDLGDGNHARFFRGIDWAATPLGPLKDWSPALRLYTYQILADSRPCMIYWLV